MAVFHSILFYFLFPCPGLVYQAPVFKLNITPVLLRKLWWFNHCQWSYASRVWLARQKGPGAVARPAAKGLILWSKNCRLPHVFPINVECSVGLEEAFIMKWPSLHQTPWSCQPRGRALGFGRSLLLLFFHAGPKSYLLTRTSSGPFYPVIILRRSFR